MFDHITLRVDDLADASEYPPRHDYRLTDMGRDLWPVLTMMRQWGDRYAAPDGPPLELLHESCGRRDVTAITGPGAVESLIRTP
jgi:hypothetical protein